MTPILYEPDETQFTSEGICRLPDAISARVTEQRNGIYELVFNYPITGKNYDKIQLGKIVAVTHDDSGDVQPFDLVSVSRPIDGIVTFKGVHISYRLNKITIGANGLVDWDTFINIIVGLGARPAIAPFSIYSDSPLEGYISAFKGGALGTVRQLLGGVEGSVLDTFGGEYEFDRFRVTLYRARGEKKDFSIRYGLNMVDYNEEIDYSETFNKCIPVWKGSDGIVFGDVIDSGIPPYNGIDNCVPLDLSDKYENKPSKARLNSAALSYMASNKTYLPKHNIEVDFIRLQDTEEYKQFANLLTCKLCDIITVIFPWYGIEEDFKIVQTEYDVLAERYVKMELGDLQTSLSEALGITGDSPNSMPDIWENVEDSAGVVTVGDLLIQYGTQTITTGTSASNGIYTGHESVAFTQEYAYKPTVMLTWQGNYSTEDSLAAVNVSTTGFNCYGRTKTQSETKTIKWLAIGQRA